VPHTNSRVAVANVPPLLVIPARNYRLEWSKPCGVDLENAIAEAASSSRCIGEADHHCLVCQPSLTWDPPSVVVDDSIGLGVRSQRCSNGLFSLSHWRLLIDDDRLPGRSVSPSVSQRPDVGYESKMRRWIRDASFDERLNERAR
jgi:hypothetical protein